jgi:hypothetical protein
LDEVREQVRRELMNERRQAANRKFLEALLKKYQIVIEWPKNEPQPAAQTTAMNR